MIPRNVPQTVTSRSITLNRLRAAVEGYVTQHPGGPTVEVIPSHIDARGFACGYVQSADSSAINAIEAIAEANALVTANQAQRAALAAAYGIES